MDNKIKILCIIREPFIDSIPNLKSLLSKVSYDGVAVDLMATEDEQFPAPSFLNSNLSYRSISNKKRFCALRLMIEGLRSCLTEKADCIIGCTTAGLLPAYILSIVFRLPLIAFYVELPPDPKVEPLGWQNKLVSMIAKKSLFIITHDKVHSKFISNVLNVSIDKFLYLPNGTLGKVKNLNSNWLREKLDIEKSNPVILHSGGMGTWFDSTELAKITISWPHSWKLVFHTSHKLDPIVINEIENYKNQQVLIHNHPVSSSELDNIVASADVGIAWYNINILGFRAKMMGLASGKIGNYLKCGVPVIVPNIPSIRDYIEEYKCGVWVDSLSNIKQAIEKILADKEFYRLNALKCYNELWRPEPYIDKIMHKIKAITI
ncbi:hypothetical protein ACFL9U_12860 [Thermodesulfobacteriota bacterium]